MDLKTIYEMMPGDYDDAIARLRKEDRIQKYLLKFKEQDMVSKIKAALDIKNAEEAFLQAHTLKGLCANLSIMALGDSASELTESLRDKIIKDEVTGLYERLESDNDKVMKALEYIDIHGQ